MSEHTHCPCCGARLPERDDPLVRMRAWCREHGVVVDFDDAISTSDAERLLGLASGVMRNWRCLGNGPPFIRRGGRCRYRLADLALYFRGERNEA